MKEKHAVVRVEEGLRLLAQTGSGHRVAMDNAVGDTAPRPAELILVALGGCTAMDVASILRKKRQVVTDYTVDVTSAQLDDHPEPFTRFDVVHDVHGPQVDEEAVRRAIELSATRYCTVSSTLTSGLVEIHHRYRVHGPDGRILEGEVVVTGPGRPYSVAAG